MFPGGQTGLAATSQITLSVDTTLDLNTPAYQGCTPAPADCSLRGAISRANADPGQVYTILIQGDYSLNLDGAVEDLNATGDLDLRGRITLEGGYTNGGGSTRSRIQSDGKDRVLQIHPGGIVTVKDVVITGGQAPAGYDRDSSQEPVNSGGGVYNAGLFTCLSSEIRGNKAGDGDSTEPNLDGSYGGGLYNAGIATLQDCDLILNYAGDGTVGLSGEGGDGGGIYNLGLLKIQQSSISQNLAGRGGIGKDDMTSTDCDLKYLDGGNGGSGGGIFNRGRLVLLDSTVEANHAGSGGRGGAVLCGGSGHSGAGGSGGGIFTAVSLILVDTKIKDNSAGNQGVGGGLCVASGSSELSRAEIRNNKSGAGGGYNQDRYGFSSVYSGAPGGGIFNAGELWLLDSSVADNLTGDGNYYAPGGSGGGIYNTGYSTLLGVTVHNNRTGNGGPGYSTAHGGNGGAGGGISNHGTMTAAYNQVISNTTGAGGSGEDNRGGAAPPGNGGPGGGLYNDGSLDFSFSLIRANSTGPCGTSIPGGEGGDGAGLYSSGVLNLTGVSIQDNRTGTCGENVGAPGTFATGGSGGGLYLKANRSTSLRSTLIAGNQVAAGGDGSGGYLANTTANWLHTTLARNTGGDGSGIFAAASQVNLTNTILASHTVGITATTGSTINLDATLWGQGSWANGMDFGGTGLVTHHQDYFAEPGFADPSLGDYHLGPLSAGIDRGVPTSLTTDLDDQPRPNPDTGIPDLGADEFWQLIPVSEVSLSAPISTTTIIPVTATAQIDPPDATPNIYYLWTPQPESGQGTETAVYLWPDPGSLKIEVTAINAGGRAAASANITVIADWYKYYLVLVQH